MTLTLNLLNPPNTLAIRTPRTGTDSRDPLTDDRCVNLFLLQHQERERERERETETETEAD